MYRIPLAENARYTRLTRNDQKAAAYQSCPAGRPESRGSERTMSEDPKGPAPAAAKPDYTIIEQKHSRWWGVRDPDDELVCLAVYRKGARWWCGGSPPETEPS